MAVNNPPGFLQNAGATHNAEITRQSANNGLSGPRIASSLVNRGGVHPHLGAVMAVTQNGSPNMSVNVGTGVAFVPGTEGTTQAVYTCVAPSTTNLIISAAHASLPRIDIIVAQVQDSAYSGATNAWQLAVVTGTPAGSPTVPAAPANSIILAQVAVAAAVTQILTANITDVRPYSSYGIIVCRSSADYPTPAIEGMVVYDMQYDGLASYNGTSWTNPRGVSFFQRLVITATSSFTKATYPGLKKVRVCCQGGGGAGGGAATNPAGQVSAGGGGQGGSYAESFIDASALAASVTCTIGAAGAGVAGGTGGSGGTTSFGAHVSAVGGVGGQTVVTGATAFTAAAAQGSQAMTGDIQIGGQGGGMASRLGSAAGQTLGGMGGSSFMGSGGAPGRGAVGENGKGYGGGGGGSTTNPSESQRLGADAAPGAIILDLYI